jgi:hypothetical protein
MAAARAWIAAPLPEPKAWVLLRDVRTLPAGFGVFGSITIGATDPPPALARERLQQLPAPGADLEAGGVTSEQWQALFTVFARMSELQRATLIEYGRELLLETEAVSP